MQSNNKIIISAVVCSHNRIALTVKAIESLINQTFDKALYEIIAIDNASTDKTADVLKEKFSKVSNFRYVYEPKVGISEARNRGLSEVKSKYIAYIDDDSVASSDWLSRIVNLFEDNENIACVGGKIDLDWKTPPPSWLSPILFSLITYLDLKKTHFLKRPALGAANIAFRRSVFDLIGEFPSSLGRRGQGQLAGEETAIQQKILNAGYKILYNQHLCVTHYVHEGRLLKKTILARAYLQGVSNSILYFREISSFKLLLKFILKDLFCSPFKNVFLLCFTFLSDKQRFKRIVILNTWLGCLHGIINLNKYN